MKAVVLAGGKGTRLAPYTKVIPKPLMPIGDMPILEVMLRQIKRAGVDEVTLAVGHMGQLLQAFFNNGAQYGLSIRYSMEQQPLGTAGPLSLIEGLDTSFLVINGDTLTSLDFRDFINYHHANNAAATIAMYCRKVHVDLGVIQTNENKEVIGYIEKPTYEFMVSMGIYLFDPRVLEYIPYNQYLDFPQLVHKLIQANERVMGYYFADYWKDLGRPDDYEQAIADFENMRSIFLNGE